MSMSWCGLREKPWLRDVPAGVPYIPDAAARDGYPDSTDPQGALLDADDEFLIGYAPGMQEQRFDIDRSAKLIPAGADLVLQIHYTPTGNTSVDDLTSIGLTLARERPAKRFYSATAMSWRWAIPPGASNFEGRASLTFGEAVQLVFIQPHMHLRGKDIDRSSRLSRRSRRKPLLRVPQYDFGWQNHLLLCETASIAQGRTSGGHGALGQL